MRSLVEVDMKIVLASRNKKKIKELQTLLGEYIEGIEILSLDDVGIYGEIEENGNSFSENSSSIFCSPLPFSERTPADIQSAILDLHL